MNQLFKIQFVQQILGNAKPENVNDYAASSLVDSLWLAWSAII